MKSKTDNPLLRLVNRDKVDLVVAPSLEIVGSFVARSRREALVKQHLDGVQRVGIVPAVGSTDTHYLVAQFLPRTDDRPNSSLDRALSLITVLRQQHTVFEVLSDDPGASTLTTINYKIPLHLERNAVLDSEVYQLWLLFDREIDRGRAWLTLQGMLLSLGMHSGTRILPYPHYRPQQHVKDVVWLPYYGGSPETIRGQLLGGTRDGRSLILNTSQTPPYDKTVLPFSLDEIDTKEFQRLNEVAEPFLGRARELIPRLSGSSDSSSRSGNDSTAGEDSDVQTAGNQPHRTSPSEPDEVADASAQHDEEDGGTDPASNRRAWQDVLRSVRKDIENAGFFTTGMPLDQDFDRFRPILKTRVFQFPIQFLALWREAVATVLGVDAGWVEDLVREAFDSRTLDGALLPPVLRRARAAGLPESRVALIVIRWLGANGGIFTPITGGCNLTYQGADYPITNTPPFSTLIWRLTRESGWPLQLTNPICDALLNEVLVLAETHQTTANANPHVPATPDCSSDGSDITRAMHALFEKVVEPNELEHGVVRNFVQVTVNSGHVVIAGTGQRICSVLKYVLTGPYRFEPDSLRGALVDASDELQAIGITWEEISGGKGKRRVIQLRRTV